MCWYRVLYIMNCNTMITNCKDLLMNCSDAPDCLMSQARSKQPKDKACAQDGWIEYSACGFLCDPPITTTKHPVPFPKQPPGGPSCSAATAHTMFPKAVGIVMKRHPQQKQAHDFLDGKACTPMEYATVQWIAPASVDSDFSIAGTISKVSLAQLQADQPNYRLWPVAHMQAAFHESQAASATAHSAAQVLREFTLLLEARCQG